MGAEATKVDEQVRTEVINDLTWLELYQQAHQQAHSASLKVAGGGAGAATPPRVAFVFNEFDLVQNNSKSAIPDLLDSSGARITYQKLRSHFYGQYLDANVSQTIYPIYIAHALALQADLLIAIRAHRKILGAANEYNYSTRPYIYAYWGSAMALLDEYDVLITPGTTLACNGHFSFDIFVPMHASCMHVYGSTRAATPNDPCLWAA